METPEVGKYTRSFGVSFAITSLFSVLLLIVKESSEQIMALMKAATGHHWVTHTLLDLIIFVVLGFIFGSTNKGEGIKVKAGQLTGYIVGSFVLSCILIAGFYLIVG